MVRLRVAGRLALWLTCSVLLGSPLGCAIDDRQLWEDGSDGSTRDRFGQPPMGSTAENLGPMDASIHAESKFDAGETGANTSLGGSDNLDSSNGASNTGVVPVCTASESTCSSAVQALECSPDGLSIATLDCEFACVDGNCGGECVPGTSE